MGYCFLINFIILPYDLINILSISTYKVIVDSQLLIDWFHEIHALVICIHHVARTHFNSICMYVCLYCFKMLNLEFNNPEHFTAYTSALSNSFSNFIVVHLKLKNVH